jgi:hypothetical protein
MSWFGDNQSILFSDSEPCSNNLMQVDVNTGETIGFYEVDGIAASPAVNPINADEVLFWEQECAEKGSLRRLTKSTGEVSTIPDVPEQTGIYRNTRWSSDGTRFATAFGNVIYVHDTDRAYAVYENADPLRDLQSCNFGNQGKKLYGKTCLEEEVCDFFVVDPESGSFELLGVSNVGTTRGYDDINWVPRTVEIDSDHDGIANGIDLD